MKTKIGKNKKSNVCANTKLFSETWNCMTVQKKSKYVRLSAKDAARYKDQLDELRNKGFFMTENGIKSTDLPKKTKKLKRAKKPTSAVEE